MRVQVLCPDVVATEFHERQGIDLSALPRMSAEDVVKASLRGLTLGEVVCAPGIERTDLLEAVFGADLAAFHAQAPQLAERWSAIARPDLDCPGFTTGTNCSPSFTYLQADFSAWVGEPTGPC